MSRTLILGAGVTLPAGAVVTNVETIITPGAATDDDSLTGDSGDNLLYGASGADTLYGVSGADSLYGGTGQDVGLDGGSGMDLVKGQDGDDGEGGRLAEGSDAVLHVCEQRTHDSISRGMAG